MPRLSFIVIAAAFLFTVPCAALDEAAPIDRAVATPAKSLWEKRAEQERRWRELGVTLIPHQPSYFFPVTYNTTPHPTSVNERENTEAKFQISFKVLLLNNLRQSNIHLYFGYTQLSLWQLYDQDRSSPFRDTNHEPEAFLAWEASRSVFGWILREVDAGLSHQSNGVSFPDSRSWNRAYLRFLFDRGAYAVTLKPWVRLPERGGQDENKDIMEYMGYGELSVAYAWRNHSLTFTGRNNARLRDNRGALRVEYSFPLTRNLTGLVQYFTGYGESLVDYNRPNNRFSVGIALSEWH